MGPEEKRDIEQAMARSFKELLKKEPFEKITIKKITDGAGVIRVTFYNHFQDKNDLLSWIVRREILDPARVLISNDLYKEAILLIFTGILRDGDFYRRAVRIEGQNSFREISTQCIYQLVLEFFETHAARGKKPASPWMTTEYLAQYYAQSLNYVLIRWIESDYAVSPEEVTRIYEFIMTHSMWDVLEEI